MRHWYAGIGARQTPADVLALMEQLGEALAQQGYGLRSGAADGADSAFERGCDRVNGIKQIFLPWDGFSGRSKDEPGIDMTSASWAMPLAQELHPAWDRLSPGARTLQTRNCYQVLGTQLDDQYQPVAPSKFIICWTPGARAGGGTGQAIRLAQRYEIPVFDLADPPTRQRLERFVGIVPDQQQLDMTEQT